MPLRLLNQRPNIKAANLHLLWHTAVASAIAVTIAPPAISVVLVTPAAASVVVIAVFVAVAAAGSIASAVRSVLVAVTVAVSVARRISGSILVSAPIAVLVSVIPVVSTSSVGAAVIVISVIIIAVSIAIPPVASRARRRRASAIVIIVIVVISVSVTVSPRGSGFGELGATLAVRAPHGGYGLGAILHVRVIFPSRRAGWRVVIVVIVTTVASAASRGPAASTIGVWISTPRGRTTSRVITRRRASSTITRWGVSPRPPAIIWFAIGVSTVLRRCRRLADAGIRIVWRRRTGTLQLLALLAFIAVALVAELPVARLILRLEIRRGVAEIRSLVGKLGLEVGGHSTLAGAALQGARAAALLAKGRWRDDGVWHTLGREAAGGRGRVWAAAVGGGSVVVVSAGGRVGGSGWTAAELGVAFLPPFAARAIIARLVRHVWQVGGGRGGRGR